MLGRLKNESVVLKAQAPDHVDGVVEMRPDNADKIVQPGGLCSAEEVSEDLVLGVEKVGELDGPEVDDSGDGYRVADVC